MEPDDLTYTMPAPTIASQQRSIEWQPIDENTPRDRRLLLKCRNWGNLLGDRSVEFEPIVKIGKWTTSDKYGWGCADPDWYDDAGYFVEPIGWLPLPPV